MILGDRDEFVGFHTTPDNKVKLKNEAVRRKQSLSELLHEITDRWLTGAPFEKIDPKRSNKRNPNEKDIPLPLGE